MAFRRKTYKRRRTVRRYKRRVASKRRAPVRPSRGLRKAVLKVIHQNTENKSIQAYNYSFPIYHPSSTNFLDNVYPLGPAGGAMAISQGTGQAQRVGNEIKTRKLTWKGTIAPLQWNTSTNPNPRPQQVKLWIIYDKTAPTSVPDPRTNFFQNGNASKGFMDDLADLWSPVNEDRYRVLTSRTFKLGYSQYAGTASSTANQAEQQAYSNNDFKLNCNFSLDLTKYYPKIVKFNDTNNAPTTRGLYAFWTCVSADGSTMNPAWITCAAQFVQTYEFEDA